MKLNRSLATTVLLGLVLLAGGLIIASCAYYKGIGRVTARSSTIMATAIYEVQLANGASSIPPSLCSPDCVAQLRQVEDNSGKVIAFEIVTTEVRPFGVPVKVTLLVTRRLRKQYETLYMNSLSGFSSAVTGKN